MQMTNGLGANIRLVQNNSAPAIGSDDVQIEDAPDKLDIPNIDDKGNILNIEHPDGSISISIDGRPIQEAEKTDNDDWFRNLVSEISDMDLGIISNDLMRGIDNDLESRKDWIETRATGIKLLGLTVEVPQLQGSADSAPVEGMSRVRHPLLLEAVLRFQANARSELLPTDGPVKIRNDNNKATFENDSMANALERDMNHYLTSTAREYYPDTDRMLLMFGFGGMSFKKVNFCPLRQRPVSETVDADDLIVNNSATDLSNAARITHRISMRPGIVKRMQILGIYRDIDLSTPLEKQLDSVQREKNSQQGITAGSMNPDDRDREIYECYCELDIKGFEHKSKGKETGLEIPYRVTIDVSTKSILSIIRNYDEKTSDLPEARQAFVQYTFVPGLGFYGIGLLHILGNTTNAITAAWRELLDAGMFASFPGFLMSDSGARQNTNMFRVPPGGGALIKTGGLPINHAVMPLPYKDPSPALMQLVDNMATTGQRLGGTSELQVGEGRTDAPVGTTLAMIEQATKVMNSVHKRMHAAQAEEFQLLANCFLEHPESFWQRNKSPTIQWDQKTFIKALEDHNLVPQADPNTSSQSQRLMKVMALKTLQAASPSLYDPLAIDRAALQAIGWSNPEQFFVPPAAAAQPPPEMQQAEAELAIKKQDADAKTMLAQAKVAEVKQKGSAGPEGPNQTELAVKVMDAKTRAKVADFQQTHASAEDKSQQQDRDTNLEIEKMRMEIESMRASEAIGHEKSMQDKQLISEHIRHAHDIAAKIVIEKTKPEPESGLGKKNGK